MHLNNVIVGLAALVPLVSAHWRLQNVTVNGQLYQAANPYGRQRYASANWRADNGNFGFVNDTSSQNMTCHNGATPGAASIPIAAGSDLVAGWGIGFTHPQGAIMSYMARCPGNCSEANPADLRFFKIADEALIPNPTGASSLYWTTAKLGVDGGLKTVTIPSNIQPGNYVLRHEILALHFARTEGGAQFYPTCINLEVSGTSTANPAGVAGNELYKSTDPGVLINVYYPQPTGYKPPGPAIPAELSNPPAQPAPAPSPSSSSAPPVEPSSAPAPAPPAETSASAPAPAPPAPTSVPASAPAPPAETSSPAPAPAPPAESPAPAPPAPTAEAPAPAPPTETKPAPEAGAPADNPLIGKSVEQIISWLREYLAAQG